MIEAKSELKPGIALIIGVDQYRTPIPSLRSAAHDAQRLAHLLHEQHGYQTILLLNQSATREGVKEAIQQLVETVTPDARVLVYFAGHGLAQGDVEPDGFLLLADAQDNTPDSWLAMKTFNEWLAALPCHHLLLVLDCCFAGAFRWSSGRLSRPNITKLYRERYERFLREPAWQVITSATDTQIAADIGLSTYGQRDASNTQGSHSPFALALFDALMGQADTQSDGVITATELYVYLRDRIEPDSEVRNRPQTPGLSILRKHRSGEYVFSVPGKLPELGRAEPILAENNPFRGLEPYESENRRFFFGRDALKKELASHILTHPLSVVYGVSGSGKSSLLQAGALPLLREQPDVTVLGPIRFGTDPWKTLAHLFGAEDDKAQEFVLAQQINSWMNANAGQRLILALDQFEELITGRSTEVDRARVLQELTHALNACPDRFHIVLTVRADFEMQFAKSALQAYWASGRFHCRAMLQNELREVMTRSAEERALFFEPEALVDRIINDLSDTPGALPLLSFALSELYLSSVRSGRADRTLTETDYEEMGGVLGALPRRANDEYDAKDTPKDTMRRVLLRMVSLEGNQPTRRPVPRSELHYTDSTENERVEIVLERLTKARLIVVGNNLGEPTVEPAHDALIQGWGLLNQWVNAEQEALLLQSKLALVVVDWTRAPTQQKQGLLWASNPRLSQANEARLAAQSWLNQNEMAFVDASQKRKEFVQRRNISIAAGVAVVSFVLAVVAIIQWSEAIQQRNNAQVRALFNTAAKLRDSNFETAALVGVEALKASSLAADALKMDAQSQLYELIEPLAEVTAIKGFSETIIKMQLSPNGMYLAARATRGTSTQMAVWSMKNPTAKPALISQTAAINDFAMSPDGQYLATGGADGITRLWSWNSLDRPLTELDDKRPVHTIAFTSDSKRVLTGGYSSEFSEWSIPIGTRKRTWTLPHSEVVALATTRSNSLELAAVGTYDGTVWVYTLESENAPIKLNCPVSTAINRVVFSLDGLQLATTTYKPDNQVRVANISEPGSCITLGSHNFEHEVSHLAFSPDNLHLTTASLDAAYLWRLDQPQQPITLTRPADFVTCASFSPDGSKVMTCIGNKARIHIVDGGNLFDQTLGGHDGSVSAAIFSPNGKYILTAGSDQWVHLWELDQPDNEIRHRSKYAVKSISLSADGQLIAYGQADGTAEIRNADTHNILGTFKQSSEIRSIAFSRNKDLIITAGADGKTRIWNATTLPITLVRVITQAGELTSAHISPDNAYLVTVMDTGEVTLWSLNSSLSETLSSPHELKINNVRFSPSSEVVIGTGQDGIWLWPVAKPHVRMPLPRCADAQKATFGFAFAQEGKLLVTADDVSKSGGQVAALCVWSIAANHLPLPMPVFSVTVNAFALDVAISEDGQWIAIGTTIGTNYAWHLGQRETSPLVLRGHVGRVNGIALNPDGRYLVSGGEDRTLRYWLLRPSDLLAYACRNLFRDLRREEWTQYVNPDPLTYRRTCYSETPE